MHELARKSTKPPTTPPPSSQGFFAPFPSAGTPPDEFPPVPAIPPRVDPSRWEDFPTFRETFLFCVSDPRANITLRAFGKLLHELVLGCWEDWPTHPEGIFRASLRATIADLRHVQGSLAENTGPDSVADLHEEHLAALGAHVAKDLGELADCLELELNSWQGGMGVPS
jgi:hypothetical protein